MNSFFTWIILRFFLYILEEDELTEEVEHVIGVLKDPDDDIGDVNEELEDSNEFIEATTEESDKFNSSDERGEIEADKADVVEDDDGELEDALKDKEGSR